MTWRVAQTAGGSALVTSEGSDEPVAAGGTPYKELFKNGATIFPRNFLFVKPEGTIPFDWIDRSIPIRSSEDNDDAAKEP